MSSWQWPQPAPEMPLMCITGEALMLSPGHMNKSISNSHINQIPDFPLPAGCIAALLYMHGVKGHTDHGPSVPHTVTWMNPPNNMALKKLVTEAYGIHPSTQRQAQTIL